MPYAGTAASWRAAPATFMSVVSVTVVNVPGVDPRTDFGTYGAAADELEFLGYEDSGFTVHADGVDLHLWTDGRAVPDADTPCIALHLEEVGDAVRPAGTWLRGRR